MDGDRSWWVREGYLLEVESIARYGDVCMYIGMYVCMYEWMPIIGRWRVSTCDYTRMEVELPLLLDSLTNDCTVPYY